MPTTRITRPLLLTALLTLLATAPLAAAPRETFSVRLEPPGKGGHDAATASFDALRTLFEGAGDGSEIVLPLPCADASFAGLSLSGVEAAVDSRKRTLVATGRAQVRGRAAEILIAASFPANGRGTWALGVRPDELELGAWFPALASTPLARVALTDAAVVVASEAHELAVSDAVTRILGAAPGEGGAVRVPAGVSLRATLDSAQLPALGPLLKRLGVDSAPLRLTGRLAPSPALLLGDDSARPVDAELRAELQPALSGLRARLPDWIQPASAAPALELRCTPADGLSACVSLDAEVEAHGDTRAFRLEARCDAQGRLALAGTTEGRWERPLGLEWLTLEDARLELGDAASDGGARLTSTVSFGKRQVQVELALDARGSARASAKLDELSVGDLARFVADRTGSSFLADVQLGDAARLTDVTVSIERTDKTVMRATGTARLGQASAELLLSLTAGAKGKVEPLLALKRKAGKLSDLIGKLSGKPADIDLPDSIWTLSPPSAKDVKKLLKSVDLGEVERRFFEDVYGKAEFELELHPGIQLGATLPVAALPKALAEALGIKDPKAVLRLDGSLAMTLDLAAGRPSAAVDALELRAELPRVAGGGAGAGTIAGLPAWMKPDASAQRTLAVRYTAPDSVSFERSTDVLAEIDGATRHFTLKLEVGADAGKAHATWAGTMVGDWKAPFGLRALTLRDIRLNAGLAGDKTGKADAGVTLSGAFDLAGKTGAMTLQLEGSSGKNLSGSFTGTLDTLGLDDITRLDLLPGLPAEGLARLADLLGRLPDLQQPTLHVALGGGEPSISLSAKLQISGVTTDLLAFVGKGERGPEALFALHPEHFSLARLVPALGKNPIVAPLANLELDGLGLLVARGPQKLRAAELAPSAREFLSRLTGEEDFSLDLTGGVNLNARIPTELLPKDLGEALAKLGKAMGQDGAPALNLRGALGASLADIRLVAPLPPISPKRAPPWLKSGQLSIVLTGAPSLQIAATLELEAEGDLLNLGVEGGIERQGAGVAIALKGALAADAAWKSPFGLEWLEIRRFSGQLSIDALANIGFGGGGDVTVGSKDIDVFAWTRINAATGVPSGLVVKGQSVAGFGLQDLADFQAAMRAASGAGGRALIPLDSLPEISVRNLDLLIASRAVPEEGISSPGFKLKGELYMPMKRNAKPSKLLSVDCEVSKEGISAAGLLASFGVGPLTWDDCSLDLAVKPTDQHLRFHGGMQLLGATSQTDLELDREHLSFATNRKIEGLGSADLAVTGDFDLSAPKFMVHGTVDNEFGQWLENSAAGEALDLGGRVAGVASAALKAADAARDGFNNLRSTLGLPTAMEAVEAFAKARVDEAKSDHDRVKKEADALRKSWQDTPENQPVLRKSRELLWGAKREVLETGPLSKVAVLARRKAQYEDVKAKVAALKSAQAASQAAQAALAKEFDRIKAWKGKTIVVTSVTFDVKLELLQALKAGMPLDLHIELDLCGEPKELNIPWIIGKPLENAKMIAQQLLPGLAQAEKG